MKKGGTKKKQKNSESLWELCLWQFQFMSKHKIHHISYSYYSQEAFDIVDPNSMQDVFHI